MLLYQIAELTQMSLTLKLKKVSGLSILVAELKQFRSSVRMIERIHQVNLNMVKDLDNSFGFTMPQQMFKLQAPSFVNISISSSQLQQTYYGSSVEVKKDQNLLLRVHLSQYHGPSIHKANEPCTIQMDTVIIQCHGGGRNQRFNLSESTLIHQDTRLVQGKQ